MHVCLISEEFPPETGWGGIGTYTRDTATGLVALGHRVDVVARTWEAPATVEVDGVRVHRVVVPEPSWRRGTRWFNSTLAETSMAMRWSLSAARVVRRIHAADPVDVVESPEYHAQGLLTALGTRTLPLVVRLHTPAFVCRRANGGGIGASPWDTRMVERSERLLARRAALLISPSRALADEVGTAWGLSGIDVVPCPIDVRRFDHPGPRRNSRLVLFAGRLERRKGVETLVDAVPRVVAQHPDVRFRFVGADHPSAPGGSMMADHLRDRLAASGVPPAAVEFAGYADPETMPGVYAGAAISVVPSLWENFPYACLEAMAAGCATVASSVGGIPEIVRDGVDGVLVPPSDVASLTAALCRLLADPTTAEVVGKRAAASVRERFGREAVCSRLAERYASVVRP